jgi:hypothetical protein
MIKGLSITPPTIGRISIGKVVERNGKRLPVRDDQFTITTQLQHTDGTWLAHPVDDVFRQAQGGKVRTIPVRLLFNEPDLNLRADFTMFDRASGRPVCVGNGEQCKRMGNQGIETHPCPGPDQCPLAEGGRCKPYGRLNVTIGDDDALGTFVFRTTGYNSLRTLTARLSYFHAVSGGNLACLPLELKLRGKTTAQSFGTPIFYADLVVRNGLSVCDALAQAMALKGERQASGYDQTALDVAAKDGFAQGAFEDSIEEGGTVLEEFYVDGASDPEAPEAEAQTGEALVGKRRPVSLASKLSAKAEALQGEPT